ncbi:hypothetical protein PCO31111_03472 [Pandoraea communis]|uniref:Uncharacterized protein n=1 Tax=Pandoraea communis TaxID=2508297 RepID=A0A5E4WWK3_9BURK|nr:hypothetical protein [Pandoraea communis]VVE27355.1 hypothetical protein PCO31111_03472 [Pandoraea communis]
MRDYSKVGPQFWIGPTGKKLRAAGMEAQIVAMYLLTSPHANMLGLYYCPVMFIAHETGLGLEGASKGLQRAIEADFCQYDEASEVVWVMEMASYQVGEALKANDLRVKGVQNEYASLPENPYLARFYEKYSEAFCMSSCRGNNSPFEAPLKPLQSQEQEQEKEQKQEQKDKGAVAPAPSVPGTDGQSSPADPGNADGSGSADPAAADGGKGADKLPRALGVRELVAEGVDRQHAEDWLKVRSAKRAPLTSTAWDDVKAEAVKAGITPADAVKVSATNSWQGFKATWYAKLGQEGSAARGPAANGTHGNFTQRNYGQGGAL